jgi:hypothetical protein
MLLWYYVSIQFENESKNYQDTQTPEHYSCPAGSKILGIKNTDVFLRQVGRGLRLRRGSGYKKYYFWNEIFLDWKLNNEKAVL